jgi:hypothetical protein
VVKIIHFININMTLVVIFMILEKSLFVSSVLKNKTFKLPHPFLTFLWLSPFEEGLALYLNKSELPSPKDNLYQLWLILAYWFWRRFLKIFSVFSLFRYYLPLERGYLLPLNNLESPLLKHDLCQVWLKLAQCFWWKFLNDPIPFLHFCDYLPMKRTWPFIWTNLNSLHPRIICTEFDWIWPAGFEEEDFKKFSVYFYSFAIISPWRRAIPFLWTNLNPLHPRMFCAKSG